MSHPGDVSRRTVLRGAALGLAALASGAESVLGAGAPEPPNIVFILDDDLGYADVACYGRPDLRTPNVDRLAERGVRFLRAYANSAVCSYGSLYCSGVLATSRVDSHAICRHLPSRLS